MKLKLTIGYDGTDFRGSQRQGNARTVQQELETAFHQLAGRSVSVSMAGRTDRGVHAVGQVASCEDIRPAMAEMQMQRALNHLLPDDIGVSGLERVDDAFHPRFDATWREYRYRIWCGGKQPVAGRQVWVWRDPLNLEEMATAADRLVGTHDLASFTGGGEGVPWSERSRAPRGTVRTVLRCDIRRTGAWWGMSLDGGHGVELRVIADGFLPQMVRTITGGLVSVGRGERSSQWFDELLARPDRRHGPTVAPAYGLILWRVGYGNDVPDPDPDDTQHVG